MSALRNIVLGLLLLSFGIPVHAAGGWTANAVPTRVEIVRNQGFMIWGPFGNPGVTPCSGANTIWVAKAHPQYAELLSTALSAVAGQLKLQAYVHTCASIGWHGGDYNELSAAGAIYISR